MGNILPSRSIGNDSNSSGMAHLDCPDRTDIHYIPDVFLIIAYCFSFYTLRYAEVEQLPTLMERVRVQIVNN